MSTQAPILHEVRGSPIVVVCVGMAGSGKTTFVHRLYLYLQSVGKKVYSINLDPAVKKVPYPTNIDIRDTVDYKKVMKEFTLGPNGAMITSLNLFATKFDQVIDVLERRAPDFDFIIVDTPGQIEVFNWSASGQIILDALAVSFPIVSTYVVDTVRCRNPTTFMSNMTYACSIMYKTKLPFVLVFNKTDVIPCEFAKEWMTEFDVFLEALKPSEAGYMASLSRALCLSMEEFYSQLRTCGVSSITGEGMEELEEKINEAVLEYHESYVPYLNHQREQMAKRKDNLAERQLQELKSGGIHKAMRKINTSYQDEEEEGEDDLAELEKLRKMLRKKD
jgi:GTPase SAR1 family protein